MTSKTIAASLWRVSLLLVLLAGLDSCTPKATTSTSDSYKEDLSKYLPQLESYEPLDMQAVTKGQEGQQAKTYPEPTNHIKTEIDEVVEKTIAFNKSRNLINGYSILVYSGTELREAEQAEAKLRNLSLEFNTRFTSPIYRTKVGRYYSKLEANKKLRTIKKTFPLAVLVSERFRID